MPMQSPTWAILTTASPLLTWSRTASRAVDEPASRGLGVGSEGIIGDERVSGGGGGVNGDCYESEKKVAVEQEKRSHMISAVLFLHVL